MPAPREILKLVETHDINENENQAGLSQKELARKLKTSQRQISRLESPSYEGHSLSMLRRVANILGVEMRVTFGRQ